MRIGVLSDTHARSFAELSAKLRDALRRDGVDLDRAGDAQDGLK